MRNGFSVTDAHCHIYPDKIAARAVAGTDDFYRTAGEVLGGVFDLKGGSAACLGTVADLILRGDDAGIDRFLVHSVATSPRQVAVINEFIAEEAAKNDRLIGFGAIHPDCDDPQAEIRRVISLGLHGIKTHPDIQQVAIDDPRFLRFYAVCEEAGLPILMHTGDYRFDYSNPNRLLPVLKQFPRLTVIGAHFGGWSIWEKACDLLSGIPNLYVDCSSSLPYLTPEVAARLIRAYGADRVLFGTDFPMWSPCAELDSFFQIPLTPDEQRAILSENLDRILK